jgi:tetratricopeptide (TPR) repeat protein
MQRNDLAWQALANLAATEAKMGHVRQSADRYRQALLLARAGTDAQRGREVQTHVSLAHRLRDLGEYGEAVTLLEGALVHFDASDSGPVLRISAEHRLAQAFMQLGQPARARPLLAADASDAPPGLAMMRLVHRADLAHLLGGDALTPMRAALARLPDPDDVYHRIGALFASAIVPPDEGEALAAGVAVWAATHQRGGLALSGHVRAAACALAQGAAARAAPHVDHALHLADRFWPDSFYMPELWLVAFKVFNALGRHAQATRALQTGVAWVNDCAQRFVPASFRDSFINRNPVNRDLLTLSTQRPRSSAP